MFLLWRDERKVVSISQWSSGFPVSMVMAHFSLVISDPCGLAAFLAESLWLSGSRVMANFHLSFPIHAAWPPSVRKASGFPC